MAAGDVTWDGSTRRVEIASGLSVSNPQDPNRLMPERKPNFDWLGPVKDKTHRTVQ